MTESPPVPQRRRGRWLFFGLVWVAWTLVVVCALIAMPTIRREHFLGWLGAQPEVIDQLVAEQRYEGALARIDMLEENMPWDPRPLQRRADVILAQVSRRLPNPAVDSEVAHAYEAAVRGYMSTMMYPYLLSPEWKRLMSAALFQWAACLSQSGQWETVSMCLEMAGDVDLSRAQGILNQLLRQVANPTGVEPQILTTTAVLAINLLPSEDALRVISHVAQGLSPADHLRLRILLALHSLDSPDPDLPNVDLSALQSDLPLRLAYLQLEAEPELRGGRLQLGRRFAERAARAIEDVMIGLQTESIVPLAGRDQVVNADQFQTGGGSSLLVVGNNELVMELPPQGVEAGDQTYLIARGQPALGVWPVLEVIVNDGEPQLRYVPSDLWTPLPISVPGGVLHSVHIRYLNDGVTPLLSEEGQPLSIVEDRNVTVHSIWTQRADDHTNTRSNEPRET